MRASIFDILNYRFMCMYYLKYVRLKRKDRLKITCGTAPEIAKLAIDPPPHLADVIRTHIAIPIPLAMDTDHLKFMYVYQYCGCFVTGNLQHIYHLLYSLIL